MQARLCGLKGFSKWEFRAEMDRLHGMSESDMKSYVAQSWWKFWLDNDIPPGEINYYSGHDA